MSRTALDRAGAAWSSRRGVLAGVFVLALALRLAAVATSGGFSGDFGYDESVYYTAGVALTHGWLPYHGHFVLVHPPLIAFFSLPFALLGRLTTHVVGFAAANVAASVVGAVNAALVVVVAQKWGAGLRAAALGGFVYAAWVVAIGAESTLRLEPLGNLLLLLGLWALGAGLDGDRRRLVAGGVAFGLLVNVKLWWGVPVVVILAVVAAQRRRLRFAWLPAAAAAVTVVVVDGPLLLLAGRRMFHSVLTAQLDRPDVQWVPGGRFVHLTVTDRLEDLTGLALARLAPDSMAPPHASSLAWLSISLGVLLALVGALALRTAAGRLWCALLAVHVVILLVAPVYYAFYGGFVAVPVALAVAAAVGAPRRWRVPSFVVPAVWVGVVVVLLVTTVAAGGPDPVQPNPARGRLAGILRHARCVATDDPAPLIAAGVLDREFRPGCPNWVDFQGVGHSAGPNPRAKVVGRRSSPAYRRLMQRYFRAADVRVIRFADTADYLGPAFMRRLTRGSRLADIDGFVVYVARRARPAADAAGR